MKLVAPPLGPAPRSRGGREFHQYQARRWSRAVWRRRAPQRHVLFFAASLILPSSEGTIPLLRTMGKAPPEGGARVLVIARLMRACAAAQPASSWVDSAGSSAWSRLRP